MKQIRPGDVEILTKGRSLLKFESDPTEVFVFSGHPIDEYDGRINESKLVLNSLTTGEFKVVHENDFGRQRCFLLENENDVLDPLGKVTGEAPAPSRTLIDRLFGKKA